MRSNGDFAPLTRALGHSFRDARLLSRALTHPSAAAGTGGDNQRLEFLGDAVLQLCVTEALYGRHPDKDEGALTQMRASLVREESLADAARRVSLGDYLRFDHGEAMSGGRDKPSVLADAVEAVLGAVYLDGGLEAAAAACERLLNGFSTRETEPNWKSALQEREQAAGRPAPVYRVLGQEGPPHACVFTVEAFLPDTDLRAEGQGASKKQAEQSAARALMEAGKTP